MHKKDTETSLIITILHARHCESYIWIPRIIIFKTDVYKHA